MTEENKYYTPTLDDFCHGLEVQTNWKEDGNWKDEIFDQHHGVCDLGEMLDVFRIKYLDRQDIEACGWRFMAAAVDIWFEKEGVFDMGSFRAYKIRLHYGLDDKRLFIYADDPGNEDYMLFRGTIKNKSELLRIMKMVGI